MSFKKLNITFKSPLKREMLSKIPVNLGGTAPHQNRGTIGSRVEDDQDPEQDQEYDTSREKTAMILPLVPPHPPTIKLFLLSLLCFDTARKVSQRGFDPSP